jgi:hypothetical protein
MNGKVFPVGIKSVQGIDQCPVPGNTATGLAFIIVPQPFTKLKENCIPLTNITIAAIVFKTEAVQERSDTMRYFIF